MADPAAGVPAERLCRGRNLVLFDALPTSIGASLGLALLPYAGDHGTTYSPPNSVVHVSVSLDMPLHRQA
ncbi:MAG: hypothetical protein ABIV28_02425 [Longimicrobiales bacterium]